MRVLTLMLACVACLPARAAAQDAVFIVRHAERLDDSRDSILSPAGEARAGSLARLLRDAGITAIYTSEFQRTEQTARPLARALGIDPTVVPAADSARLVDTVRTRHASARVLIVGHSNTVPQLVAAFGSRDPVTIADDEYTNLFVVMPRAGGSPAVLRLRY